MGSSSDSGKRSGSSSRRRRRSHAPVATELKEPKGTSPLEGHLAAQIARWVLIAAATITPWVAYPLEASIYTLLYLTLGIAWVCWFLSWKLGPQSTFETPWGAAPLLLALALGLWQLVPWPGLLYPWIAPGGGALEARLTAPLDPPQPKDSPQLQPAEVLTWPHTTSLAPSETRRELTLLILMTAAFLLAARFLNHKSAFFWLCVTMAANAAALTLFGIVQQYSWKGLLFWRFPTDEMAFPFAAWQNKNNAGGFLNMGLGAAVGCLVWSLDRAGDPPGAIPIEDATPFQNKMLRWSELFRWRLANIDGAQLGALAVTATITVGILICVSRGAIVGMVVAGVVLLGLVSALRRQATPIILTALLALPALGLFYFLSQNAAIQRRFALSFNNTSGRDAIRAEHWLEGLGAATHFKLSGAGLGTYRLAYPPYVDHAFRAGRYEHAENQFVEAALTGGVPGFCLLSAALIMSSLAAWRLLVRHIRSPERGFVMAGVFVLVSQTVCALFDFGLYKPANMLLLAVVCGAVCGRATHESRHKADSDEDQPPVWPWLQTARHWAPVVVAALCVWGVYESWKIRNVEAPGLQLSLQWSQLRKQLGQPREPQGQLSAAEAELSFWLDQACDRLAAGLAGRPDDVFRNLQLADYYQTRYGLDPPEFVKSSGAPPEQQRQVNLLYAFAQQKRREGPAAVAAWRELPTIQRNLLPALECLQHAALASPLEPRVFLGLARLDFLTPEWNREAAYLEIARRLARSDAGALYESGVLELYAGRTSQAWADWKRSLSISASFEPQILAFAVAQLTPEELADRVLPASPEILLRVAANWYAQPAQQAARDLLAKRAEGLRYEVEQTPAEQLYLQGRLYFLNGQTDQGIKAWTRAVELEPSRTSWRYELALALRPIDLDQALTQARECVRQEPKNETFNALVRQLLTARRERDTPAPPEPGKHPPATSPDPAK